MGEGDDAYKGIKHEVKVMKSLGAVAELKAEIDELKVTYEIEALSSTSKLTN